jgi:hypothetical protein
MNLARHFVIAFAVLANFYSKDFSLGTLYISIAAFLAGLHQSPRRLPIPPYRDLQARHQFI